MVEEAFVGGVLQPEEFDLLEGGEGGECAAQECQVLVAVDDGSLVVQTAPVDGGCGEVVIGKDIGPACAWGVSASSRPVAGWAGLAESVPLP
jgi:hypothetical protein